MSENPTPEALMEAVIAEVRRIAQLERRLSLESQLRPAYERLEQSLSTFSLQMRAAGALEALGALEEPWGPAVLREYRKARRVLGERLSDV